MSQQMSLIEGISFKGKQVLITGSAAGIGRAIARRFAEAGARLQLLDADAAGMKATEEMLASDFAGSPARRFVVDLADKAAIDQFWSSFTQEDLPDILINNAGIYPMKDFLQIDEAALRRVLDINFNAVFWMCQHFIQRRGKAGGIIVNASSIEAVLPFNANMAHYSASKAGVVALTRSLARDYGAEGFRANVVMPGGIKTEGTTRMAKQAIRKLDVGLMKTGYDFWQRLPNEKLGDPDDVAKAVIFLSSDLAS